MRENHGLTSDELEKAMRLYTAEKYHEIMRKYGLDPNDPTNEKLVNLVTIFMSAAFTAGMELGGNTYMLAQFWNEHREASPTSRVSTYEFEEDKGISGVLFPDGGFQKCGNAEHYILLEGIPLDVQMQCVYFSSMLRGDGDGVISMAPKFAGVDRAPNEATEPQCAWIRKHFKYMDRGQKRTAWRLWDIDGGDDA